MKLRKVYVNVFLNKICMCVQTSVFRVNIQHCMTHKLFHTKGECEKFLKKEFQHHIFLKTYLSKPNLKKRRRIKLHHKLYIRGPYSCCKAKRLQLNNRTNDELYQQTTPGCCFVDL